MAELIRADGRAEQRAPRGEKFSLEELKAAIGGGYVEMFRLLDGRLMWMDEDGKRRGYAPNQRATYMARVAGLPSWDVVVGDVLITSAQEVN